ncbi:MAG TPA: thiamine pyrophosphate-dependent enzyme [Ilumatobacteraceae bacterium]|jgi:2-oxoglutarate ferredoxin oxidoreductase subunit beta
MKVVAEPSAEALAPHGFDFCPGCGYGSVLLALTDVVASLERKPVFMVDIGCVDFMTAHMPGDVLMGPHGRTSVLASGYKRMRPDRLVCAIQGDGGFMGLGATESLHTAARGEPITIIVLNNGVLADTGGQLAATTLSGKATSTTPAGRASQHGAPVPFLEMLAMLGGVAYAERVAIDSALGIRRMRRAIGKAFAVQGSGAGLTIVEVLSPCPTHWRMDTVQAWEYIRESVSTVYPTGVLVDRSGAPE